MSAPLKLPPRLVGAIHMGDKRDIAAELACSGIGAGILPYHGIRSDGICTCGNPDCADAGKHPDTRLAPHGALSAVRDADKAWRIFDVHSEHNIGLVPGDHFAVGDWDPRHGADVNDLCGFKSTTLGARTGGGGVHRLARVRPQWDLSSIQIGPGVQLRTGNQPVVVERSRHRSGGTYEWINLDSPIAFLPRETVERLRSEKIPSEYFVRGADTATARSDHPWSDVEAVRLELLRDKHRDKVRLLLTGEWEGAGYPSQSEAEYNLVLLASGVTDDLNLALRVLLTSGLANRDREGTRREDGHGHKLDRDDYVHGLLRKVATRRDQLQAVGDPNLPAARRVFAAATLPQPAPPRPSLPSPSRGGVVDAKKKPRGRPRGGRKKFEAMGMIVEFLSSTEAHRERSGYIRLPVLESAKAMGVSDETIRQAIAHLLRQEIVEGPEPIRYVRRGEHKCDRLLRLRIPRDEALRRIGTEFAVLRAGYNVARPQAQYQRGDL